MGDKVLLSLDKHTWHPSPLVGQVVLVTTLNVIAQALWIGERREGCPFRE